MECCAPRVVRLVGERERRPLVRPGAPQTWQTEPDEVVSLLPLKGDANGVRTIGLRWPLAAETLHLGDTRGVSNESVAPTASVSIEQGLLLVTRHFPP